MGKSAPSAPDPYATAQAQAGMNRETAITQQQLNMVNQYNPWGSVEYRQIGNHFTPSSSGQQYYYNAATGEYKPVSRGGFSGGMSGGGAMSGPRGGASGRPGILFDDAGNKYMDMENPIGLVESMLRMNEGPEDYLSGAGHPGDGWELVRGELTPQYGQYTNLTPEQQAIFDQSQQAQLNLSELAASQSAFLQEHFSKPFEYTNRDAETWAYDLASPRILEQQRQNQAALQTQLRNQGLAPGSAAWNAEMNRLTNANTDQLNQLALTGRQQGFAEALAQRNQPINEITALLSGSQVSNPASMSSPTPQTGVAGVDYTGLVNNKYQAELQQHQAKMGGLFGLGSALIGALPFSDERLKENKVRVGETPGGTPVYQYNYKADPSDTPQIGVMAQDVPDARVKDPSGYYRVDYSRVS